MRITEIRTVVFEYELARPLGDVNSPSGRSLNSGLVVYMDTDAGITGLGLGSPQGRPHVQSLAGRLIGSDPRGVRGLWKQMMDSVFKLGPVGPAAVGLSALDLALWDLKAKANDEPLWRTLGASSPRVRAYASGLDSPLSDDELHAFYAGMAAQGVSAGKLKGGANFQDDLRRLGIMRDALATSGKRVDLMLDVNEFWTPKEAIRRVREIERNFDLTWIEEPARRWDATGLRQVSDGVAAAVASGENLRHPGEFLHLIDHRAIDVFQVGSDTCGITGAMIVADMVLGIERPVSMMNSPGSFMAHAAAAMPNHAMLEVLGAGRDALFDIDIQIDDGWLVLGKRPGFGIEFDADRLAAHTVEQASPQAMASPWGRRPGAGLYA
ncbi:MAG: mandelate racemase/muconate lactonizing enzyme family protein [Anaerolineaceae bacterium]|nr:mandelate racemase/muconate lactonizing enzyme family protein [Anaerolineaceae bacterium]